MIIIRDLGRWRAHRPSNCAPKKPCLLNEVLLLLLLLMRDGWEFLVSRPNFWSDEWPGFGKSIRLASIRIAGAKFVRAASCRSWRDRWNAILLTNSNEESFDMFYISPHLHLAIIHGRACATETINYKMNTNEWIWHFASILLHHCVLTMDFVLECRKTRGDSWRRCGTAH